MINRAGGEPLVEQLLAAGLLTATEAARCSTEVARRARYTIAIVAVGGRPRYVVKTARQGDVAPLVAHERRVLQTLARSTAPSVAPAVADVPRLADALVVAHLDELASAVRDDPLELGQCVAVSLARLHTARPARAERAADALGHSAVPALLLPRLVAPADRHPATAASLRFLAGCWRAGVPIHGDVKWEHVRCDGALIDWELAGVGDPAWDLASLLHELCIGEAPPRVLGQVLATYARHVERPLHRSFLQRTRAALAVRCVQSAEEYRASDAASRVVDRAEQLARWWAHQPEALDACLAEAA